MKLFNIFRDAFIRRIAYVIVALIVGSITAQCAHAESYTSTGQYYYPSTNTSARPASIPDACALILPTLTSTPANFTYSTSTVRTTASASAAASWRCTWTQNSNGNLLQSNVSGDKYVVLDFTCAAGTKNYATSTCTATTACTAPLVRNTATGACEIPPPTCTTGSTTYTGAGTTSFYTASGTEPPSTACINGCTVNLTGIDLSFGIAGNTTARATTGGQTGASCTGTNVGTVSTAEQECLEQGKTFITLNGATSCAAPGTPNAATVTKKTTSTTTATNSSGTTATNTTTNTTVNNNQVTVTNTTVTTNPDGTTSTATDGTTQSLNTYCQATPAASICTDGSFSNGSTTTGGGTGASMTGVENKLDDIKDKLDVDESGNGSGSAGYPTIPDSFYTATYENGIKGVYDDFKSQVNTTQFVTAINGFVPSGWDSGTEPSWTIDMSALHTGYGSYEITVPSYIWNFIRIAFIVTTLFLCRRIIFGG